MCLYLSVLGSFWEVNVSLVTLGPCDLIYKVTGIISLSVSTYAHANQPTLFYRRLSDWIEYRL